MREVVLNSRQTVLDGALAAHGTIEGAFDLLAYNPGLGLTGIPQRDVVMASTPLVPGLAAFLSGQAPETTPRNLDWIEFEVVDCIQFGFSTSYWAPPAANFVYGPQGIIGIGDEWGFVSESLIPVSGVFRLPLFDGVPFTDFPIQGFSGALLHLTQLPPTITSMTLAGFYSTPDHPERQLVTLRINAWPPALEDLFLYGCLPDSQWPPLPASLRRVYLDDLSTPVPLPDYAITACQMQKLTREAVPTPAQLALIEDVWFDDCILNADELATLLGAWLAACLADRSRIHTRRMTFVGIYTINGSATDSISNLNSLGIDVRIQTTR